MGDVKREGEKVNVSAGVILLRELNWRYKEQQQWVVFGCHGLGALITPYILVTLQGMKALLGRLKVEVGRQWIKQRCASPF